MRPYGRFFCPEILGLKPSKPHILSRGGHMKNIVYVAKIVLGAAMVLLAAFSLRPFGGAAELALGAALLLAGVVLGALTEKRRRRFFVPFSLFSLALTVSLYFIPVFSALQYLSGGFLVYFACALVFDRKNAVIS